MNSLKSRAMNCKPSSEMIRGARNALTPDWTMGPANWATPPYSSTIAAVRSSMRAEAGPCRRRKIFARSSLLYRPKPVLCCRPSPYLNNVIEQDHRFIKKRIAAGLWFRSAERALRTIDGYEAMHLIRKGQIRWLPRGDVVGQRRFIMPCLASLRNSTLNTASLLAPPDPICNRSIVAIVLVAAWLGGE